ncbi:porin family protein, partial [Vibrio vulnificus]|nr:porin family protein [Vibrio vulnificus]
PVPPNSELSSPTLQVIMDTAIISSRKPTSLNQSHHWSSISLARPLNNPSLYPQPTLHYTTTSTDWDQYTASYIDDSLIMTTNERKKTRNSSVHSGIEVGSEWHFTPRFSMTLSYQYLTDALNVDSPEIKKEFDQQAIKIGVLFDI